MKKFAFDQQFMVGVVAGGAAVAVVVSMVGFEADWWYADSPV